MVLLLQSGQATFCTFMLKEMKGQSVYNHRLTQKDRELLYQYRSLSSIPKAQYFVCNAFNHFEKTAKRLMVLDAHMMFLQ